MEEEERRHPLPSKGDLSGQSGKRRRRRRTIQKRRISGSQKEAPSVPSGDDTDKEEDKDRLKKKLLEKKAAVKAPLLALDPPKPKGDSQQGRKIVLKQRPKN